MQLASDAGHDDDWSSPDKAGSSDAVPVDNTPGRLWLAANNPEIAQPPGKGMAARAAIADFLVKRQSAVLEVLAEFTDQRTLAAALLAVANELQHLFQCDRVALGLINDDSIEVVAISQQAVIEARTDEVRLLREAMQEACDQETMIDYSGTNESYLIVESHHALTLGLENSHVCTIPLCDKEKVIGALLLQRRAEKSWSQLTLELLSQIATLTAPLVVLRRDAERGVLSTMRIRTHGRLASLIAPKHLIAKGSAVIISLFVAFAGFLPVTHNIKASAEIVPTERRVISAPTNGFINSVFVNAGDHVRSGDILIRLDTRELELEQAGQENEVRSARAELRAAMASYDRKELSIAQAQLDQIEAELALTRQRIVRTSMTAPIDGVIVSGDLSQSLGMSVERGKVLLEMAPADGYEVHLLVNEVDMPYVREGQTGRLSLEADPSSELVVEVSAIHPIAQASGGANRFLVETALKQRAAGLRPGQTGIVKVGAGEASLLWVLTHRFLEWSRQRLWEWTG